MVAVHMMDVLKKVAEIKHCLAGAELSLEDAGFLQRELSAAVMGPAWVDACALLYVHEEGCVEASKRRVVNEFTQAIKSKWYGTALRDRVCRSLFSFE